MERFRDPPTSAWLTFVISPFYPACRLGSAWLGLQDVEELSGREALLCEGWMAQGGISQRVV